MIKIAENLERDLELDNVRFMINSVMNKISSDIQEVWLMIFLMRKLGKKMEVLERGISKSKEGNSELEKKTATENAQ